MKIIRITGKLSDGREWWKEFHCHGTKNIDEVCEDCILKFACFTDRDKIEVEAKDLPIKRMDNIEADTIADYLTPTIKVAVREDKSGKKKVQMNFKKVRKFV